MLAVNDGRKDPRECGFIAWDKLLSVLERAFTLLNQRPTYFQEQGRKVAPDDAWTQDMAARVGGRLPACPPELLWHFLPVKSEVGAGIAQAGHVKVSVPGYPMPFFFRIGGPVVMYAGAGVPEEGIERNAPFIERGHRVIVAFDPQRAAEGAVIFNAERGPKNTQEWRPFQKLMLAPLAEEAPQFNLARSEAAGSADIVAKKVRDQQVRASFTSIGLYGQGARRVRQDHDGRGNVSRVESGAPARTDGPMAPAARQVEPGATPAPRPEVAQALRRSRTPVVPDPADDDFTSGRDTAASASRRAVTPASAPPLIEEW
jgi:hypothetical protein